MMPLCSPLRRRSGSAIIARTVVACAGLVAWTPAVLDAAEQPSAGRPAARPVASASRPKTMIDPAVTPAGGHGCRDCGPAGCSHGHATGQRHHRDCRNGVCVPFCPVRPTTFGFYGTNWRKWPGQGVVPVSHEQLATPALPPRSEVPGVDDESFKSKPGELPEPRADEERKSPREPSPQPDAPPKPAADATEPRVKPQEPGRLTPRDDKDAAAEESLPPARPEAQPDAKPEGKPAPKPRPQDEDLFDEKASRVRRRFPVVFAGSEEPQPTAADVVAPAALEKDPVAAPPALPQASVRRPTPKPVPRVPFDPRVEGRSIGR